MLTTRKDHRLPYRAAAAGMRVALLDVVEGKLRAAAESCAGDATIPVVCDVTDPASCAAALEAVEQQWSGAAIAFLSDALPLARPLSP